MDNLNVFDTLRLESKVWPNPEVSERTLYPYVTQQGYWYRFFWMAQWYDWNGRVHNEDNS